MAFATEALVTGAHRPAAFDAWTRRAVLLGLIPLLGWDAASVYSLAVLCHVSPWVAWIPAISTSGIMLAGARISTRATDPHVRTHAQALSWVGLALGVVIAAIQHTLPSTVTAVPWPWMALIGGLPVAMGGWLWHIYSSGHAAHEAEIAAAQRAEAQRTAALAAAEQQRLDTQRDRDAEVAHQTQLAAIAVETARAEQAAQLAREAELAEVAERRARAEAAVASAVTPALRSVPDPASSGPLDALGRRARPAPKRDAALRWLLAELTRGRDLATVTPAEVDQAIGAAGYAKRYLDQWVTDVRDYAAQREVA